MKTVAVIQPYFFPYAGYFRLFAAADIVVMFDCVQFPRRGWVHRNRFPLANGELDWLTLSIAKVERDARIDELRFRDDAAADLRKQLARFPVLQSAQRRGHKLVDRMLSISESDVAAYLCASIQETAALLGIERPMLRSSSLNIPPDVRAQDRIIEIVRRLGGSRYVNPSGGRSLYDKDAFECEGLELRFLAPFTGPMESILAQLIVTDPTPVRAQIESQTILEP